MTKDSKKPARHRTAQTRTELVEHAGSDSAAAPPALGQRIHLLRQARRWSLSELSKRSTIATSTLSKVENGILSLAYDRLQLIAGAFGLTLSEFFAAESSVDASAVARISWAHRGSGEVVDSGAYVYHYLCTSLRAKRMVPILSQVIARTLPEFGRLLRHEGEEFVFAHLGRVEVHTEFYKPQVLEEGEGVYIDSRMGHAYTNAGPGEAWILSVNTSPISPEVIAKTRTTPAKSRRRSRSGG
ncbi:MAG TPA: XRE family transcriptional regulator [Steroidobacteraceae bacterium]|nr:XRE family transcriptional regulator [Steroidobacteraceae bacterium]